MEAANENTIRLTGKDLLYWYMKSRLIKTLLDNQEGKEDINLINVYDLELILKREVNQMGIETFTEHQIKMLKYVLFGRKLPADLQEGLLDILMFLAYGSDIGDKYKEYSGPYNDVVNSSLQNAPRLPAPNRGNGSGDATNLAKKAARNQWEADATKRERLNTKFMIDLYNNDVIFGNIMYNQFMKAVEKLDDIKEQNLAKDILKFKILDNVFEWQKLNSLDDINKNKNKIVDFNSFLDNIAGAYIAKYNMTDEGASFKKYFKYRVDHPWLILTANGMSVYEKKRNLNTGGGKTRKNRK